MATRSMEVDVRARGVTTLAQDLRNVASAAREVAKETSGLGNLQVGRGTAASVRTSNQAGASETREQVRQLREQSRQARDAARETARESARQEREERFLSGPRQDLLRIQADRERALRLPEGDVRRPAILGDLGDREARARRRVILNERLKASGEEGLQAPGLLQSFQQLNALMSSIKSGNVLGTFQHLGAGVQLLRGATGGVNLQGLLGGARGAVAAGGAAEAAEAAGGAAEAVAGLGAAAGPAGVALAAAAASLVAVGAATRQFVQELSQVAESLNRINRAQVTSGGTRAETLGLVARGIPAGAIGGMAASLRERLSSDPLAMSASGLGFRMPRPFGDTNEARDLIQALDTLRGITNVEERLRVARLLGIDAATQYLLVSEKVAASMKADAALRERLVPPETNQAAIDFEAELGRVGTAMQLLKDTALAPELKETATDLAAFAAGINSVAEALKASHLPDLVADIHQAIRIAAVAVAGVAMGPAGMVQAAETISKLLSGRGAADTATAAHTRAMQDHTRALVENSYLLTHGFSTPGQDARMRRVVPEAAWNNPMAMREAFQNQGLGAGGYRL